MTTYVLAGRKGGLGKSTLAIHLCAELQRRGRDVLLVDADGQRSASTWARRALPQLRVELVDDRDQLLDLVQAHGGDCVVDVAGAASDMHLVGLFCADLVVLPTGASSLDLEQLAATVRLVASARAMRKSSDPRACAVLNRADVRTLVAKDAILVIQNELQLPVVGIVPTSVSIADAPGQGTLAAGPAGEALRAVCTAIIDHDYTTKNASEAPA